MYKYISFLILPFIFGCSTNKQLENKIDFITNDTFKVSIDKELLIKCEELPEFKGKTMGDLYKFISIDINKIYYECSNKNKTLIKYIENIK